MTFWFQKKVPGMISEAQNSDIKEMPTYEEVKKVIFSFNRESAGKSDGFTSLVYQTYWEIIGQDIQIW